MLTRVDLFMKNFTQKTILATCLVGLSIGTLAAPKNQAKPAKQKHVLKKLPSKATIALQAKVKGKLSMPGCNLKPQFKVSNKLVLAKNLKLTKFSDGYLYTLTLLAATKVAKIKPYVDLNKCIGNWSPFDTLVVVKKAGETIYNKNFKFKPGIYKKKIPIGLLTSLLQNNFKGTKIRLNNYGPKHGNSWYKGNSSYVQLSSALGGKKQKFSIPAINTIPYRYYVNNVNLQSISVDHANNKLRIRFKFEGKGTEIKGRCKSGNLIKNIACAAGSDSSAPDVQMNGAVASVYLKPKVYGDKSTITYGDININFKAKIQAQGICKIGGDICNAVSNYKSKIRKGIKNAMRTNPDNNKVRKAVANALRSLIKSQGIKNIINVVIYNGNLIIQYRPFG